MEHKTGQKFQAVFKQHRGTWAHITTCPYIDITKL